MPTQIYEVTASPVNLVGAIGIDGHPLILEVGKRYQARYAAVGVQAILKVVEVSDGTPVVAGSPALPVRIFEDIAIIPAAGLNIFVWSEGGGGQLIINDVV